MKPKKLLALLINPDKIVFVSIERSQKLTAINLLSSCVFHYFEPNQPLVHTMPLLVAALLKESGKLPPDIPLALSVGRELVTEALIHDQIAEPNFAAQFGYHLDQEKRVSYYAQVSPALYMQLIMILSIIDRPTQIITTHTMALYNGRALGEPAGTIENLEQLHQLIDAQELPRETALTSQVDENCTKLALGLLHWNIHEIA